MKRTVVVIGIWVVAWSMAATAGWNENLCGAAMLAGLLAYTAAMIRAVGGPRRAFADVRDLLTERLAVLAERASDRP